MPRTCARIDGISKSGGRTGPFLPLVQGWRCDTRGRGVGRPRAVQETARSGRQGSVPCRRSVKESRYIFAKPFVNALLPLTAALATAAGAQQGPAPAAKPATSTYAIPIGPSIGLDAAKRAATAASAEARKNGWFMAIAVVDPAGTLVYYEKADTTQLGSAAVAIDKARSAALYKRPTKAFEDALAKGGVGLRVLALQGAVPVDGGVPLLVEGKIVGAIGVSGDLSEHDAQCATVGAAALTAATTGR